MILLIHLMKKKLDSFICVKKSHERTHFTTQQNEHTRMEKNETQTNGKENVGNCGKL